MKKSKTRPIRCLQKLSAALCALALMLCSPAGLAQNAAREIALPDGVLSYEMARAGVDSLPAWAEEALPAVAGTGGDWVALALRQYRPDLNYAPYADALAAFAETNAIPAAASRQRVALLLIACGRETHPFVAQACHETIGAQGIMTWIFGLHLLQNGQTSEACTREDARNALLALQLPDGGFAIRGDRGDADVTAMALQALAMEPEAQVREPIQQALAFLSQCQQESGGYVSSGAENAESAAQVIIALTALGIDPQTDARFLKNGLSPVDALAAFRLPDGSYCHVSGGETNETATAQALCALVALERFRAGQGGFYQLDPLPASPPEATAAFRLSGRGVVTLGIAACGLLVCLALFASKKRHYKNYLLVAAICAVLTAGVWLLDVQRPQDYYGQTAARQEPIGQVTLSIRCDTIVGLKESPYIPASGEILPPTAFSIAGGDTVYDVLVQAAQQYGLQLDCRGASALSGQMAYVAGIQYLYEFDFGDLSGWVYHVNGVSPDVGCGAYALADGDRIEWLYTRALGNDVK